MLYCEIKLSKFSLNLAYKVKELKIQKSIS